MLQWTGLAFPRLLKPSGHLLSCTCDSSIPPKLRSVGHSCLVSVHGAGSELRGSDRLVTQADAGIGCRGAASVSACPRARSRPPLRPSSLGSQTFGLRTADASRSPEAHRLSLILWTPELRLRVRSSPGSLSGLDSPSPACGVAAQAASTGAAEGALGCGRTN